GACTGTGPCDVDIDGAKSVTATFAGPQTLTVTADSFQSGSGTVSISPANSPPTSTCTNTPGAPQTSPSTSGAASAVDRVPVPAPDSVFLGWSGACAGVTGPRCTLTMDQAKSAVATFRGPQALTVTADSLDNGSGTIFVLLANSPFATCANT